MALTIQPSMKSLFRHSNEVDVGMGRERVGQSTAVVALDGTGDFDSIQDALDFLPDTGGAVYIKEGTYIIYKKITITKPSTTIIGASRATKIFTTAAISIFEINTYDVTISDITFDGDTTATNGIEIINANTGITINRCGLGGFTGSGVFCNNGAGSGADIKISDCYFGSLAYSINLTSYARCIIYANKIGGGSTAGILSDGEANIIANNIIRDAEEGIHITDDGDNNIISGNHINNNGGTGVLIDAGATDNILVGNYILNNEDANLTDNGTDTETAGNITA